MTLQSAKLACECLCLLAVAGSAVYAVRDLHETQVQTREAIAASTATLEFINRPCMSLDAKGHLLPDGTLCQFNQAIHDMRKIVTQSGEQVKQTGLVITAASRNLDKAGDSVTDLTGHLTKTADAATETARSASATLQTANETIGALKAPIAASTLAVQHFDALVTSDSLASAIEHADSTLGHVDGITGDFQHYVHPILNRDPCTTRKCVVGRVLGKVAGYVGLTADGARIAEVFSPIKVKLAK